MSRPTMQIGDEFCGAPMPGPCVSNGLSQFFRDHPKVLLAFSGGADSSYLLYAAKECGADVVAYTLRGPFQARSETAAAIEFAGSMGVEHHVIDADPLSDPGIASNGPDRCYLCKKSMFNTLRSISDGQGRELIDATNLSDDPRTRPGMRALEEFGVLSPLRLSGINKSQVRELSRRAGLPTADVPSNSCLATRIMGGIAITSEALGRVEESEQSLSSMGFSGHRVRDRGDRCVLEVRERDSELLRSMKAEVESVLRRHYTAIDYGRRETE
jgi:uncharacterized protein